MTTVATAITQTNTSEHNGWCNRETWLVSMWLGSDPVAYDMLCSICDSRKQLWKQAELLEEVVRESLEAFNDTSSMWRDLVESALGRVDWRQIAESNQGEA